MIPLYLPHINKLKIVLGSTSESRKHALNMIGIKFETMSSKYDEKLDFEGYKPNDYVKEIARGKMLDICQQVKELNSKVDVVICGDTLIHLNGKMFQKPKDKEDAVNMLKTLCGKTHQCISAIWVGILNDKQELIDSTSDVVSTDLTFKSLTDEEIRAYVDSGESMGNSGSYMIDGLGSTLLDNMNGCYYGVCGLPLGALASILIPVLKKNKLIPN